MLKLLPRPGWFITIILCLIPIVVWEYALPIQYRFLTVSITLTTLGQIAGITGLVLFAVSLILGSRLSILEKLFGGMNRVYIAHHLIGGTAFLFLLVHPLLISSAFLPVSANLALSQLLPSSNWPVNLGITALLLLMSLLIFTYWTPLAYQIWRFTHKFMGLAFFLGGLHALFIPSDISRTPALKIYILSLSSLALLLYLYRTVFGRFLVPRYPYRVHSIRPITPEVVEISVAPLRQALNYLPGQFVFISFSTPGFTETHPFSMSSSPSEPHLTIASKSSGDYTQKLSSLPLGSLATIEGPFGYFTYSRYENHHQLWIAGGIGITPFYSMAKSLLPEYTVDLYYAATDVSEAVYLPELTQIAARNPSFHVFPWYSKSQGRISAPALLAINPNLAQADVFLCGPPPMMASLRFQFRQLGFKNYRIHSEEFKID